MKLPVPLKRILYLRFDLDYTALLTFGIITLLINLAIGFFNDYWSLFEIASLIGTAFILLVALLLYKNNYQTAAHIVSRSVFNILMLLLSFSLGLHTAVFVYYIPITIGSMYFLRDKVSQKQVAWYCLMCMVFIFIIITFCPVNPSHQLTEQQVNVILKLNAVFSFILSSIFLYIIYSHLLNQNLELETQKSIAENIGKAKDNFLSVMSHELRTPLNGIIGSIELMQKERDIFQKEKYVSVLKQSSSHMLNLINDILDYNKLLVHKMEIKESKCNVKQLVDHVYNSFAAGFSAKQLDFRLEVDEILEKDFYLIDDVRLTQVLSNLLSNALKYTDKGGVDLMVKYTSNIDGQASSIYFEIKDTGVGIPEARRDSVFDTFNHLLSFEKRFSQSTGLGLSISKQIIELMNGKIDFISQENIGTRFFFTLTFRKVKPDLPVIRQSSNLNPPNIPENLNYKILIAEDNPINMMIAKKMLLQKQIEVHEATNGQEVIQCLQSSHSKPFHLLLLDLQLPVMTGYEVMNWIKKNDISLPVIAFTANLVDKNDLKKLKQSGFTDVLPKPFQSDELYGKIYRYAKTGTLN